MKLLSFDIEISDVFELGKHEDMEKYAPFHISVGATAIHNGEERVWYSDDDEGRPALCELCSKESTTIWGQK